MAWNMAFLKKNALNALVGGIMSELTGNGFLAVASASAVNEMVRKKLSEQFAGEPDKHQWASIIIGSIVLFICCYIDCLFFCFLPASSLRPLFHKEFICQKHNFGLHYS